MSAFTPGPNNLIALASGLNYGFARTLPHVFGATIGFAVMTVIVGAGLGYLFQSFPLANVILKWASLLYLLYLAWKIAHSKPVAEGEKPSKPMTFWASILFQWINPKGVVACLTIISAFVPASDYVPSLTLVITTDLVVAFVAISTWALFGVVMKRWLSSPKRLAIFNWTMAILLVLSILPSFFS